MELVRNNQNALLTVVNNGCDEDADWMTVRILRLGGLAAMWTTFLDFLVVAAWDARATTTVPRRADHLLEAWSGSTRVRDRKGQTPSELLGRNSSAVTLG